MGWAPAEPASAVLWRKELRSCACWHCHPLCPLRPLPSVLPCSPPLIPPSIIMHLLLPPHCSLIARWLCRAWCSMISPSMLGAFQMVRPQVSTHTLFPVLSLSQKFVLYPVYGTQNSFGLPANFEELCPETYVPTYFWDGEYHFTMNIWFFSYFFWDGDYHFNLLRITIPLLRRWPQDLQASRARSFTLAASPTCCRSALAATWVSTKTQKKSTSTRKCWTHSRFVIIKSGGHLAYVVCRSTNAWDLKLLLHEAVWM